MIRDKLTERVEDTVVAALDNELRNVDPQKNPPVEEALKQEELQPPPAEIEPDGKQDGSLASLGQAVFGEEDNITADSEFEPVRVAGPGGMARRAAEALSRRTEQAKRNVQMQTPTTRPVQQTDEGIIISPADPEEIARINEQLGGEYTKGLNMPQILRSTGEFDAAEYLERFKDANQELFEQARRGTISFDSMMEMAEARGFDDIVTALAQDQPGRTLPPEDVLAGILAHSQLITQARKSWQTAFDMPAGPERDAAMNEAMALATVQGRLAANVSATVSEAGRTMQVVGELGRRGIPGVSQELQEITLFGAKTTEEIELVGRRYLMLTEPAQQRHFAEKGMLAKSMDVLSEIWINSILSAVPTHLVNIFGNTSYQGLHTLETFVASGIGRLRTGGASSADRVQVNEAVARLEGIRKGLLDAVLVAGHAFRTEVPVTAGTKIDTRVQRAIGTTGDPAEILQMIRDGEYGVAALNAFGAYTRVPGRFLLAEDEFFKGIAGRAQLYEIAQTRGNQIYRQTLDTGGSVEDARAAKAQEMANIIANPSEEVRQSVEQHAKQMAFQEPLEGWLGRTQNAMAHPLVKLAAIPFFRTPVNIMRATLQRSPIMAVYPKFWQTVKAGGREADMAIARATVGSMIMSGFAYSAYGLDSPDESLVIIGAGPRDREARQAMFRQGFQPYSINIRQEDGTYKSITFSRFDPISGILAMGADFARYAQHEEDAQRLQEVGMLMSIAVGEMLSKTPQELMQDPSVVGEFAGYTVQQAGEFAFLTGKSTIGSTTDYLMTMPLLEGLSQVQYALLRPDGGQIFDALSELFSEKAATVAMSAVPGVGAASRAMSRVEDPTLRNTMLPAEGFFGEDPTTMPPFMRGVYTAMQKAMAGNPMFNQELPPRLNEWGEEMQAGYGVWWEFISPIRIRDTKYSAIDQELVSLGDGFSRTPKKINGVLLNAEEYNEWILLTNELDDAGRTKNDPNYNPSTTLKSYLERAILTPEYQSLPNNQAKVDFITNIHSTYRRAARQILLQRNANLRRKVNSVQ